MTAKLSQAPVERHHRDLALGLLYKMPVQSELRWAETGEEPDEPHEGIKRAIRVAEAIARAGQECRELERSIITAWLRSKPMIGSYHAAAADIETGAHLEDK